MKTILYTDEIRLFLVPLDQFTNRAGGIPFMDMKFKCLKYKRYITIQTLSWPFFTHVLPTEMKFRFSRFDSPAVPEPC